MKRLMAFLLALLLLTSFAYADFGDQAEIEAKYTKAVSKMNESGVIGGFPNGTFRPKDSLSRAECAATFLKLARAGQSILAQ